MSRNLPGKRRYFGLSAALLLQLTACAWIPSEGQRAEFRSPPSMEHTLTRAIQREPLAPLRQWPNDRWWRQFGSAELDRLVDRALRENPGLKASAARLRQAQALARVEGARLLPFLDAEAGIGVARISEHGFNIPLRGQQIVSGFINPLSLRYQFDFWGKNRAALEAALGEAAAEAAEWADVRLQLTTAIARAYFRGLALRRQLELCEEMVELRRESLDLAETRFQLGLDSADPAKQARIDLEDANKRQALIRDQLELQRNLLARLTGAGPDATHHLFTETLILPDRIPLPAKLPVELLAHRPDLAAALHRAEAAAERIQVAKASFLPTIDLTAFVGVNALRLTKGGSSLANLLFSGSSFSYGIAPGLRLPLFEGGRLRGELSAQRAEYDAAVELYNDTLLHAIQEVADHLSGWRESDAILDAHERLLTSRREDLDLARERLSSGLDDRRILLARRHAVLDQTVALKALEANRLVATADLIESLGGGYASGLDRASPLPTPE